MSLSFELELKMGMRCYFVLLTGERGVLPIFRRELGKYVLPESCEKAAGRSELRSTHEISANDKGKQQLGSLNSKEAARSIDNGQVERGSRPGTLAGGAPAAGVKDIDLSTGKTVVEHNSHDADVPVSGPTLSVLDGVQSEERVVELSSNYRPSSGDPCTRATGIRTDGPNIARVRTKGLEHAQFSERSRLMNPDDRTLHGSRSRRVELWKVKPRKFIDVVIRSSEVPRLGDHMRIMRRGDRAGLDSLDPLRLVGSEENLGQVHLMNLEMMDPIFLCEVYRDSGCNLASKRPVGDILSNGPPQVVGPDWEAGDVVHLGHEKEQGCELGGANVDKVQVDITMEVTSVETGLDSGSEFGLRAKTLVHDSGPGLSLIFNKSDCVDLENINFKDEEFMPNVTPPVGFNYEFITRGWVLRPSIGLAVPSTVGPTTTSFAQESLHSFSVVVASSDINYESYDSISEFERNLRELLPDLPGALDHSHGTRRSERKKNPSSRFNEEAGYIVEPLRSSKKKAMRGDIGKGTSSKPCLISDWNNVQLAKY